MRASGDVPVPIAFGYHPYLRLPEVERSAWGVEIPVSERVVPTPRSSRRGEGAGGCGRRAAGPRTFDDEFAPRPSRSPSPEEGAESRSLRARLPLAQVYAPDDDDVIAFEPMTAPTNALVSGQDLKLLEPDESYEASFSIKVSS